MISDIENVSAPGAGREVRPLDWNYSVALLERFCAVPSDERPSDWVANNIVFNEPEVKGPFDFTGRQYLRQPIDDNNDSSVSEQSMVFGTGCGKTLSYMAGVGYKIVHHPQRGLWVMPSEKGATGVRNFNNSRLRPMCEATEAIAKLMPTGANRFNFSGLHIRMGGMVIDFAGANSPGQLASNRCGDIRLDEVDKFKAKLGNEAGAVYIAKTRADGVVGAQIFQASTPTIETGAIWQSLLVSNLNRRFIPCPRCGRDHPKSRNFVIVWNEQYSVLPNKFWDGRDIPVAQVRWDKEAKRADGTWDMDRVVRSARAECPHCGGHILDSDMIWCDENGLWIPTKKDSLANRHQGYHLPAMYQARRGFESTFGGLAKKFLEAGESSSGMRGFINSVLSEVDVMQASGTNKIELTSTPVAQVDWVAQFIADFQKNYPYMWFTVRKWCAFKLLPPIPITNGQPEFVESLELPENAAAKALCTTLVDGFEPAWFALAELQRFDSRTGRSPIIDFLLAQKIVGERLVKLFREDAGSNTLTFRKILYQEMDKAAGGAGTRRPPIGGDSELVAAGHMNLSGEYVWDELREIVQQFEVGRGMGIPERCVAIDCGYAEKFNREVLRKCYESATDYKYYDPMSKNRPATFYPRPIHNYCVPSPINGWLAMKGYPMNQRWNHGGLRNELNVNIEDPFFGTANAGTAVTEVLEFPQGLFWLRKDDLRQKRAKQTYAVSPKMEWFPKIHLADGTRTDESNFKMADYERQLNEQFYDEAKGVVKAKHGKGGAQGRLHPYHLDDCETMQIAMATYNEFFDPASGGKS